MKIKQYIVTYNNSDILNTWILRSMFESLSKFELDIIETTVINNHSNNSIKYHNYCGQLWYAKYNYNHWNWDTSEILRNKDTILNKVPYYVYYPYFEKDVETLIDQGLIWDKVEDKTWF